MTNGRQSDRTIVSRDELRDQQTREASSREVDSTYRPPSMIPDPPKSDEWVYRWIRLATYGEPDSNNAWQRRAEGWDFVAPSELPDMAATLMTPPNHTRLEVGGLALCRAPRAKMEARARYYRDQTERQMQGIDAQLMKNNDPRMPLLRPERTTRVTTG
jgi:hypothetical protein